MKSVDQPLRCGCSAASACPKGQRYFDMASPRGNGNLFLHLAAQLRPSTEEGRRLHTWKFPKGEVAIKRCVLCGVEHTTGKRLGRAPRGRHGGYYWRNHGSAWQPYPPLPECLSREERVCVMAKTSARKKRAA